MLEVRIHTDGSAFWSEADGVVFEPRFEGAAILRKIADRVERWEGYDKWQTILDSNGNDVGRWRLTEESA